MHQQRGGEMLTFLLMLAAEQAHAADPDKPHTHQGIATPFSNPKPTALEASDVALLKTGKSVRKQVKQGNGGRGIAIMDVDAPEETVWAVITDFDMYPKWIDQLESCEVYEKKGDKIFANFVISTMMIEVGYYIEHTYSPGKGHLTWTLDYSRESDLDDSTGYWLVYPSPDNPGKTRVEYSVDLRVKGWIPSFIEDMLADQGLEDATTWMKRESEKRAR
jgi:ribosome-associated toxin RatA of RatAB toxin-antitoxin module